MKFNLNMLLSNVRFSARVLVVGTILTLTFFLLSIDSFKTYRSDVFVLVSAKSELAQKQQDQLINNMIEFPQTLSFYNRLLKLNPDVRDITSALVADERKATWNEMISVGRTSNNASVLKISIVASREADAQQLAIKSARTLFDTVAFYYDVKKDVDLRIIDGPITNSQVSLWYVYLIASLFLGFSIAILLNLISFSGSLGLKKSGQLLQKSFFPEFKKNTGYPIEQELESLSSLYEREQAEQPFVFESNASAEEVPAAYDEKFQEVKKITKELEPSKYPNFPEMPVRVGQMENVPSNLPIAEEEFFFEQVAQPQAVVTEEIMPDNMEVKKDVHAEPSEEELKKRLNSLLRGEL